MSNNKSQATGGMGLSTTLTIIFVVLKLTGLISWSWWWVLSPLWIPALIVLSALGVMALVLLWASRRNK